VTARKSDSYSLWVFLLAVRDFADEVCSQITSWREVPERSCNNEKTSISSSALFLRGLTAVAASTHKRRPRDNRLRIAAQRRGVQLQGGTSKARPKDSGRTATQTRSFRQTQRASQAPESARYDLQAASKDSRFSPSCHSVHISHNLRIPLDS